MTDTAAPTLQQHLAAIGDLRRAAAMLEWDADVMMPPHGANERSRSQATLRAVIHEKATAPALGALIDAAVAAGGDEWQVRNAQLLREQYCLATGLPQALVYELEQARAQCLHVWGEAKAAGDWAAVLPHLEKLFGLVRAKADIQAGILGCAPYDAQLRQFARGNSQALIEPLFAALKRDLPPLVREIASRQQDVPEIGFSLDVPKQKRIARKLARRLGFSFRRGRLDVAVHPFSGGTSNDNRITTAYDRERPLASLLGVVHEVGHALYDQGLPPAWQDNPVGDSDFVFADMSLHESQSLIFERHAGLSDGALHYLHRLIVAEKADFSVRMPAGHFINQIRRVAPSLIRINADEATYPLHVVLRYEIERDLFAGRMTIADIPAVWNAKIKEYFGLDVPNHTVGCLQDLHWFMGMFGYFPTYSQGALYAAQLFDAMRRDMPDIEADFANGHFKRFRTWLRDNIHQYGQLYDAPDLIARATHAPPDAVYFLNHLRARYLPD